jgi:hypothetical protein
MFKLELKITGLNVLWITSLIFGIFTLLLFTSGNNIDLVTLFFEIFMPLYVTIVSCEVVKIKTDPAIENVLVNAQSYFRLVVRRYNLTFGLISALTLLYMGLMGTFFRSIDFIPMALTFFVPSFFLSSFGLFFSFLFKNELAGSLAGGLLWLVQLLARGVMQKGVPAFFFLFISFFSTLSVVWAVNRLVLILLAFILWILIHGICRERKFLFGIAIRKTTLVIVPLLLTGLLWSTQSVGQFLIGVSSSQVKGNRNEKWLQDITFLQETLPEKHKNLFFQMDKEDFHQQIESIKSDIPKLNDDELTVRLSEIIASVGDAHTRVSFDSSQIFPFGLYWFKEGIYCINTTQAYKNVLHKRLTKVNGMDVEEVLSRLNRIIPSENEWHFRSQTVQSMIIPQVLKGLDLLEGNEVEFTFADSTEKLQTIKAFPEKAKNIQGIVPQDSSELPFYRRKRGENYWFEYLSEDKALYVKYNACANSPEISFKVFTDKVFSSIEENQVEKLIIDLRNNGGGNSLIFRPFLKKIQNHPRLNDPNRLFVVTGRSTFSSTILNVLELKNNTKATFIGEPTGGKPNHYGEVRMLQLTNIGLSVSYSTNYFEYSKSDTESFIPDIVIEPSFDNYYHGKDAVLENILSR